MAKAKASNSSSTSPKKMRPALTPEARENQLIALAVDLAEQQLRDGTASSQVISHFLKLGSSTHKMEKEMNEKQQELMDAKIENIKINSRNEEVMKEAIEAMRTYQGHGEPDEY